MGFDRQVLSLMYSILRGHIRKKFVDMKYNPFDVAYTMVNAISSTSLVGWYIHALRVVRSTLYPRSVEVVKVIRVSDRQYLTACELSPSQPRAFERRSSL